MQMLMGIGQLFTGAAPVVAGGAPVAAAGISFSSILQGGLGLMTAVSQINAGNAQADSYVQQANDAQREQPLEALQGIARRSSIKRDMADAVGSQDVANAASSVDLSFGTPAVARKEAFREGDMGITSDNGTEQVRVARLMEKEANYRKMAVKAKQAGKFDALTTIVGTGVKIANTWG